MTGAAPGGRAEGRAGATTAGATTAGTGSKASAGAPSAGAAAELWITVEDSVEAAGREAWTALADACDASVFYRYDFLSSVESLPLTFPSRARYLMARDATGELVAALPLYLQETRDPFSTEPGGGPVLNALVGHVWHCYDTTLLSREPLTAWLVEQFWTALGALAAEHGAELWGLVNIAVESELASQLKAIGVELEETVPRYRLPIAGGPADLDEHLSTVSRPSRRTLRQYVRRAERAGARTTLVTGRDGLDQAVLDLCLGTADKHAPGYYPQDRLGALIRRLGEACRILRIELDGRLLAASICMYDGSRMHAWAGGCEYPPELNWSPQYVLFAAELEAGFASGLPVLECGRRNDVFKTRYGLTPHRLARAVCRA
ncbi:GNAT family N-acetyltransferase [Kitasatospora sp. NPDC050543]|uniref:GNAT family N-acetyltransferase n=1 Tax=Kitasatospora sp. NPDC050543 TaxID=3364054 RepID=UPI00379B9E2B